MFAIRAAATAAGLMIALAATPAMAAPSVVVVDYGRVYDESAAGKDAQAKLKAIGASIDKELGPAEKQVEAELKALEPRIKGKTDAQINADLKKDKAFSDKFQNAKRKQENYLVLREVRLRELNATEDKAIETLVEASRPAVEESMKAKKASLVLRKNQAIVVGADADITSDVIARLNKKVTTLTVTKVNLTRPAAGAKPATN
jgi:Skp family chaperone for outer membrane proteins